MTVLTNNLQILLIGGDQDVYSTIRNALAGETDLVDICHVEILPDQLIADHEFDAVLVDLPQTAANDKNFCSWLRDIAESTPVIVLTENNETETIPELSRCNDIIDFLPKSKLDTYLLRKSISYSLQRKKVNQCLKKSEEQYRELFEINPVPMFLYDWDSFTFIDVNRAAIETYGYSKEEFLAMTIKDIRPNSELPKLEKILQENTVNEHLTLSGTFTHIKKNGETIQVEIQSKFTTVNGKKAKFVLVNNVTERLKTQEALKLSEQRFKSLVQDSSDLISILNEEAIYQYVSPTSTSVLGLPPETLIGTSAIHYIHPDDRSQVVEELETLTEKKHIRLTPFRHLDNKNNWRWLESTITYMLDDPAVKGIVTNSRDITENVERELKLKESVSRYDIISKATSDTIWDLDIPANIVTYNDAIREMFGYEQTVVKNALKWWKSKIHPDDLQTVLDELDKIYKDGINRFQLKYRFRCVDGSYKFIYDRASMVTDENGRPIRIIGAIQDMTEVLSRKKELQTANKQLKMAQKIAKMGYWTADIAYHSGEWSEELCHIYGVDPETFVPNMQTWLATIHPEDRELVKTHYQKLLEGHKYYDFDHRIITADGQVKWLLERITLHRNDDGSPKSLEGITQDITERKTQEAKVLASLKEKETLLAEIHHRVKNNLAVVSSLMQLQVFKEENSALSYKLLDSVSRIKTMANIHEQLYQSNNFADLEFCRNLRNLVFSIIDTLKSNIEITHTFDCKPIQLSITQAVPCALIVNEVVTNILKHAFTGRNHGDIFIHFSQEGNLLNLRIDDDGVGIPEHIDPSSGKTLGLHLIDTLSKQLDAEYHFESSKGEGTRFELRFEKKR